MKAARGAAGGARPLRDLAESLVDDARKSGADGAEVSVADGYEFHVDVRRGRIETLIEAGSRSVGLKIIKDKRTAYASSSDLAPSTLRRLVRNAVRRAELGSADEFAEIEDDQLRVGQGRVFLRGEEDLPVRGPAGDRSGLPREGAARGQAAGERHRIDLGRALILGGEGQGPPVGRDGRIGFEARVRGQAAGCSAADVDGPEVALRGEDNGVAVEGREAVVAVPSGGGTKAGQAQGEDDDRGQSEGFFHGRSFPGISQGSIVGTAGL